MTTEKVSTGLIRIITQPVGFVAQSERKARLPSPEKIAEFQKDSLNIADESLQLALLNLGATLERLLKQSRE